MKKILELCIWGEDPKLNLLELTDFTSHHQSTKAVDPVYGILGLANESLIAKGIDVNYEKSIQEIHWDLLFEFPRPTNIDQPGLPMTLQHRPLHQTVQQWQNLLEGPACCCRCCGGQFKGLRQLWQNLAEAS